MSTDCPVPSCSSPAGQEHPKQNADDHDGGAGRGRDAKRLAPAATQRPRDR